MKKIAILASGGGTNLEAILKEAKAGNLPVEVAFCFSDKKDAKALERARNLGFKTIHFSPKEFVDRESYEEKLRAILDEAKADLIILAGYMRLLGPKFVKHFENKIVNIHPALLPNFKGTHSIKDAWEHGVKVTGITVHIVNEEMDAGPILAQVVIPIAEGEPLDELEERIHREEHRLYPAVIKKLATSKYEIKGRKVIFN